MSRPMSSSTWLVTIRRLWPPERRAKRSVMLRRSTLRHWPSSRLPEVCWIGWHALSLRGTDCQTPPALRPLRSPRQGSRQSSG
jgi:hypothetical protein